MGERNMLEYSIIVHQTFSINLLGQIGALPNRYSLEFKSEPRMIPSKKQVSKILETQFILLPKVPHFMREEIEKYEYSPIAVIANLGGLFSSLTAFYMFCFGMSKVEPWGAFQKMLFRFWSCRESFKHCLKERYNALSIPLGKNVEDQPEGVSLEDRFQMREILLNDYFLDSYHLDILETTSLRHDERNEAYQNSESLVETRSRAIANMRRVDEQNEEEYLRERKRKHAAKRWSNWSRRFGFSSRPTNTNNNDEIGMESIDSSYSPSIPSPRRAHLSIWSSLRFGDISHNNNYDEELGITSSYSSASSKFSIYNDRKFSRFSKMFS